MYRTAILFHAARHTGIPGASNQSTPFLKVAIVGGGASGLSTALHLAPLVSRGLIQCPIHLYEASELGDTNVSTVEDIRVQKCGSSRGSGAFGRNIGVGIWSSALLPFDSSWKSHKALLRRLDRNGQWIGNVGYRCPDGSWLMRSKLSPCPFSYKYQSENVDHRDHDNASLLFLQENELISALRDAVSDESNAVKTHYGRAVQYISLDEGESTDEDEHKVHGYSDPSVFAAQDHRGGRLIFSDGTESRCKYNLIVDAGGMQSRLRSLYSRHLDHSYSSKLGKTSKSSPGSEGQRRKDAVFLSSSNQRDMDERGYTVFRGNASLGQVRVKDKVESAMEDIDGFSFQTWGTGKSMRFATVPVTLLRSSQVKGKATGQVWFVTVDDPKLLACNSAVERKDYLLNTFKSWHDPICELISATPANEILIERAIAHRHVAAALGSGFERKYIEDDLGDPSWNHSLRDEPLLCFVGDADMTVDPVLAQGFTIGMEDSADVARCVEKAFTMPMIATEAPQMMKRKHPLDKLRIELERRHMEKEHRLLCLLRATELVQTLAQPQSKTLGGLLALSFRPLMKYAVPQFIKKSFFGWMLRYSLGMSKQDTGGGR